MQVVLMDGDWGPCAGLMGPGGDLVDDAYAELRVGTAVELYDSVLAHDRDLAYWLGDEDGTVGWLSGIELPERYRGLGYGRQMLEQLIAEAEELEVRAIYLDATPEAEPFYQALGFEPLDEWAAWLIPMMLRLDGRQGSARRSSESGLVRKVQRSLSDDLLKPGQKGRGKGPLAGHCYVAAQALWHLLGAERSGWSPVSHTRHGVTHWWLENDQGRRLDPTGAQFPDGFPYERGTRRGFLTGGTPSKRAQVVIDRVKGRR